LVQLFCLQIYQSEGPVSELDTALAAAQRGGRLDANDCLGHRALGFVHFGRKSFELAEYHYSPALRLNPTEADSILYPIHLDAYVGEPDRALDSLRLAMRLKPSPPNLYWAVQGIALYGLRRYAEAANAFERATARTAVVQRYLAASYAQMDRAAEVR